MAKSWKRYVETDVFLPYDINEKFEQKALEEGYTKRQALFLLVKEYVDDTIKIETEIEP